MKNLFWMSVSTAVASPMVRCRATHSAWRGRAPSVFVPPPCHRTQYFPIPSTATRQRQREPGIVLLVRESDVDVAERSDGSNSGGDGGVSTPPPPLTKIPTHLVPALDLAPLMSHVASYAWTRRGREAIEDLARTHSPNALSFDESRDERKPSLFGKNRNRGRRDYVRGRRSWNNVVASKASSSSPIISIALSAEEAAREYDLVHQAMTILHSQQSKGSAMPLPPMFQLHDGISASENSDDDEWIDLCLDPLPPGTDVYEEIDLEMILKAEQVVKLLLDTHEWATSEIIEESSPGLLEIVLEMECSDKEAGGSGKSKTGPLEELYQAVKGAVEIVRAGPSLSDINGSFSYQFQLASGNGRFPEMDRLKAKEDRLLQQKHGDSRKLGIIQDEISIVESQITRTLIALMIRAAPDVQRAMDTLARLDAVFARASFGCDWDGVIPKIGAEGRVHVEKFVHPVLALEKDVINGNEEKAMTAVPVDLMLSGKDGYQTLMISGPNGGGKTLALKSFGLVAMMSKLGIPITISRSSCESSPSIVDFFEYILVEVGDSQSISTQESTLMARLNALASLIEKISATNSTDSLRPKSSLVLLDELGGGTDPVAGSALAQSVIEKLISTSPMCKLVATTHSPQLKALSIADERFQCASVLMDSNEKSPIFQLNYGTTGDSFALEAARRCRPSLPDDVIDRAAELMDGGDGNAADSLKKYLLALDKESRSIRDAAKRTEDTWKEVNEYKKDMISKIQVSRMQLSRLESRLESIFDTLKKDETTDTFELVGDSLEEIRLLKRKVLTEEEQLAKKGLRRATDSHSFYEGEMVVIILEGEWKGYDAVVKAVEDPQTLAVAPVLDVFSVDEDDADDALILSRRDVAVYDYPDWGFSDDLSVGTNRKQTPNVLSILSNLDTSQSKAVSSNTNAKPKGKKTTSFTSARQRKAAAAGLKRAEKLKKSKSKLNTKRKKRK